MAEEMSTWISRGFRTISDPFSRLCYILEHSYHVEGISQDHQEAKMDPGFLAEILEWHERLDESSKDPEQRKKLLGQVHAEKDSRINDLYKELEHMVQKQGSDSAYLDRMIYGIRALQFYGTIQERLQALSP
jgi:DnaJ-domain-containing protein 1